MAASVSYLALDTATQGSWLGVYGSDGYACYLPGGGGNTVDGSLAGVGAFVENAPEYVFAATSADVRAPQLPDGSNRFSSVWYSGTFDIDVRFADSTPRIVSLYIVDWDTTARRQRIDAYAWDAGAGSPSGSIGATYTSPGSFNGGHWVRFVVAEGARFTFTLTAGDNAVCAFVAVDLATAAVTLPQLECGVRGMNRGMFCGR